MKELKGYRTFEAKPGALILDHTYCKSANGEIVS